MIVTTPASPVMVTGRKGTRNYMPDDAEASDDAEISAETIKENAAQPEETAKEGLDRCQGSWDKGTHIAQNTSHQICERQIKSTE